MGYRNTHQKKKKKKTELKQNVINSNKIMMKAWIQNDVINVDDSATNTNKNGMERSENKNNESESEGKRIHWM